MYYVPRGVTEGLYLLLDTVIEVLHSSTSINRLMFHIFQRLLVRDTPSVTRIPRQERINCVYLLLVEGHQVFEDLRVSDKVLDQTRIIPDRFQNQ